MISQESNWWVFAGCFLIWLAEPWAQCFYLPPSHGTIHTPNIGLLASLFAHLFKVKSTSMKTIVCTDLQTFSHCRDFNLSPHHWPQQILALSVLGRACLVLSTDKCGKVYQTCAFIIRRSADPNLQSGQGYIADRPCLSRLSLLFIANITDCATSPAVIFITDSSNFLGKRRLC